MRSSQTLGAATTKATRLNGVVPIRDGRRLKHTASTRRPTDAPWLPATPVFVEYRRATQPAVPRPISRLLNDVEDKRRFS
jgi:hypothetical protein